MRVRTTLAVAALGIAGVLGLGACSSGDAAAVTTVDATELLDIKTDEPLVVLDVRTPQEYAEGHIDGAVNIDVDGPTFADEIGALDKDASYVVYCRSGNRSTVAAEYMIEQGFTDVYDVDAGLATLAEAGVPLVVQP